jgi:hypothetical protein
MAVTALIGAIDELVETAPAHLADSETIVELHRQLDRLEAVVTRASGRFDTDGEWMLDGARTAASWVAFRCHLPRSVANRRVALARALRDLPACERAWVAGDISAAHVGVLAGVRRPATEERLAADEEMLVGEAKSLSFWQFVKLVEYWAQHADPDGEDRGADDDRQARKLHLSQSIGGLWFIDGVFDPLSGSVVANELARRERALFEADWAEAKARLGHDPTADDLARTPAQRRVDALVEMAIRSRSTPSDARRPEPLFTVLVGWETLRGRICELANGTVVSPAALLPWLESAWLERVVFESPSRVLDVGEARRLFTGATRRAVEVRDQQCFHPLCDVTGEDCQVDHVIPYTAGGPTIQSNGRLACGFHNRERHKRSGPGRGRE